MKACIIPRTDGVVAVVASGWDKRDLFVTLFVYDWNTQDTARFNIPVIEQQNKLKLMAFLTLVDVFYFIFSLYFIWCIVS